MDLIWLLICQQWFDAGDMNFLAQLFGKSIFINKVRVHITY